MLLAYTHMGLINPLPGVVDFDGFHALQPLYDAAKAAGIWIVLRPGPYINAETSAGGITHWATSEVAGTLQTNATDWKAARQPFIKACSNWLFIMLLAIVVPLTYNDPGEGRNFINGTDAVDLYSLDPYPQGFDCSSSTVWRPVNTSYHSYHASVNPSQAWYFPEFQGGSFDAWGPTAPAYPPCRVLTGPDFQSVFDRQLWASNAKLINYYMIYGQGAAVHHGVSFLSMASTYYYMSYDYGASITESRELTTKFDELKRQGIFLRSSPEFYKTDWIADSSTGLAISSSSAALITFFQNPDTKAGFYIVRQTDSTSTSSYNTRGRKSKVIATNYAFGSSRLVYSTAQVFFAGTIDGRDVHFLYGDSSQAHESELPLTVTPNPLTHAQSSVKFTAGLTTGTAIVSFESGIEGLVTAWDSDKQLVLFADSVTAATFWSPVAGKAADLKDSLPEVTSGFSNASWAVANHMTTNIPPKPYCENIVLWRGHFEATGNEKNVNLSINRGEAFAASVWANNVFLGTSFGNSTNNRNILEETDDKFTFPAGSLKAGKDNVITIVQDNMGLNETNGANPDTSKSPRGVREFKLDTGSFGAWKVQGKVGGYTGFPDKVRGVFNENGLFGERKAGTFRVFDVPMSFTFEEPFGQPYRAILFVNGWMMGKGVGNLGPQAKFPMHEGILDYRGENTVAVALWAMTPNTLVAPNLQLVVDGVFEGGVGGVVTNSPKWSAKGRQSQTVDLGTRRLLSTQNGEPQTSATHSGEKRQLACGWMTCQQMTTFRRRKMLVVRTANYLPLVNERVGYSHSRRPPESCPTPPARHLSPPSSHINYIILRAFEVKDLAVGKPIQCIRTSNCPYSRLRYPSKHVGTTPAPPGPPPSPPSTRVLWFMMACLPCETSLNGRLNISLGKVREVPRFKLFAFCLRPPAIAMASSRKFFDGLYRRSCAIRIPAITSQACAQAVYWVFHARGSRPGRFQRRSEGPEEEMIIARRWKIGEG
ncbi:hypothetical protein BD779DRAFT_1477252 [Infundibulicybe gibba]|nr:hypothetical protein BD779DRAFT_1477252 [Infundibulicybe gibba]